MADNGGRMNGTLLSVIYALTVGCWLAALQVVLFCRLQMLLSSAFLTYLTVVLAWILGAGLGVWIPRGRWSWALVAVTGLAPYVLLAMLRHYPFDTRLLGVHGVCIGLTALFAGQFFQQERDSFAGIGALFFWENTGFVAGLLAGGIGIVLGGSRFVEMAPGMGLVCVCGLAGLRALGMRFQGDR